MGWMVCWGKMPTNRLEASLATCHAADAHTCRRSHAGCLKARVPARIAERFVPLRWLNTTVVIRICLN